MTNGQVIVAALVLLGFFSVLAGLIVLIGSFLNVLAYRWERHSLPRQIAALEDALTLDLADRCNVVRLHSATVDQIRPRRGPAA